MLSIYWISTTAVHFEKFWLNTTTDEQSATFKIKGECDCKLEGGSPFLKKLRGLSPQANYTDRATAAVGEVVPTFADRGVLRGQRNGSPRPLISIF
jgi:hypothetical protein